MNAVYRDERRRQFYRSRASPPLLYFLFFSHRTKTHHEFNVRNGNHGFRLRSLDSYFPIPRQHSPRVCDFLPVSFITPQADFPEFSPNSLLTGPRPGDVSLLPVSSRRRREPSSRGRKREYRDDTAPTIPVHSCFRRGKKRHRWKKENSRAKCVFRGRWRRVGRFTETERGRGEKRERPATGA